MDIDTGDFPQVLIYQNEVLEDRRGGHTFQNHLGEECPAMLIQHSDHRDKGHPYLPWSNANQVWVTNLVYIQIRMTMKSANTLLQGLEEGKAWIDGINFGTAKKILGLLDHANYVLVHSFYSWYSVLFLVYVIYNLVFLCIEVFP